MKRTVNEFLEQAAEHKMLGFSTSRVAMHVAMPGFLQHGKGRIIKFLRCYDAFNQNDALEEFESYLYDIFKLIDENKDSLSDYQKQHDKYDIILQKVYEYLGVPLV